MGGNNNQQGLMEERFYTIPVTLTAGTLATTTTTPAVAIGALPFRWEELGADWNATNGDWSIRITDMGDDKSFSPARVKVAGLCGASEREPYKLPVPWTFKPGSAIHVEGYNAGGATDTLELLFIGRRLNP